MIDIESELFTKVASALRERFTGIFVTGEYVKAPPAFPCVMFIEADNTPLRRTQTQSDMENHVTVMYETDVFSNKTKGKKAECKAIAAVIDSVMLSLGFDRTFLNPIPNLDDATVYRVKGRYIAVVSKDHTVYRRS